MKVGFYSSTSVEIDSFVGFQLLILCYILEDVVFYLRLR